MMNQRDKLELMMAEAIILRDGLAAAEKAMNEKNESIYLEEINLRIEKFFNGDKSYRNYMIESHSIED